MVQGRVFTLTRAEAESSSNVVEGTISILSCSERVLMDNGALHSFILESFTSILAQFVEPVESTLVVATPGDEGLCHPHAS